MYNDDNQDVSQFIMEHSTDDMYSKKSELKVRLLIYGIMLFIVICLFLPWCVGIVEFIKWLF